MNKGAVLLIWAVATVILTVICAILFHPAVFIGTIIGMTTTTMMNIANEKR